MARHEENLLIWFPNFLKYNLPESPNVILSWPRLYQGLPECDLKYLVLISAKATIGACSEAFTKAFQKAFAEDLAEASRHPMPNLLALSSELQEEKKEEENTNVFSSAAPEADAPAAGDGASDDVALPVQGSMPEEQKPEPSVMEPEAEKPKDHFAEVVDLYNRLLVEEQPQGRKLPKCTALSDKRRSLIKARCKTLKTLDEWEEYFRRVARCPWLMGDGSEWRAAFDWLLNVSNFLKVQEGNFLPDTEKKAAKRLPLLSKAVDFVSRYVAAGEDAAAMVALFCQHNRLEVADYEPAVLAAIGNPARQEVAA
jgi:hypothetical protein